MGDLNVGKIPLGKITLENVPNILDVNIFLVDSDKSHGEVVELV